MQIRPSPMTIKTFNRLAHTPPPLVTVHPGQAAAANSARERIETSVRAAWTAGEQEGERTGYRAGWRFGMQLGAFYGAATGAACALAAVELVRWWLA